MFPEGRYRFEGTTVEATAAAELSPAQRATGTPTSEPYSVHEPS